MLLTNISPENIEAFAPIMTAEAAEKIMAGTLGAVGAIQDKTACGVLVYELWKKERLLIHELTVSTPFRRRGVSTKLLQCLKGLSLDNELLLTCTFPEDDAFRALFTGCGFSVSPVGSCTYSVSMEELHKPSALDKLADEGHTERISAIGGYVWKHFRYAQTKRGLRFLSQCEERKAAWVDTLCLCAVRDGDVTACIIVERKGEKDCLLSYAYASAEGKNELPTLLATARQRLLKGAPPDSRLFITAVNPPSKQLVEKLLPGAMCVEKYSIAIFEAEITSGTGGKEQGLCPNI